MKHFLYVDFNKSGLIGLAKGHYFLEVKFIREVPLEDLVYGDELGECEYKIVDVISNTAAIDGYELIVKKENDEYVWGWEYQDDSEFESTVVEHPKNKNILEFNDKEEALLWWRLQ